MALKMFNIDVRMAILLITLFNMRHMTYRIQVLITWRPTKTWSQPPGNCQVPLTLAVKSLQVCRWAWYHVLLTKAHRDME